MYPNYFLEVLYISYYFCVMSKSLMMLIVFLLFVGVVIIGVFSMKVERFDVSDISGNYEGNMIIKKIKDKNVWWSYYDDNRRQPWILIQKEGRVYLSGPGVPAGVNGTYNGSTIYWNNSTSWSKVV